jgi:hemerythrin superfamily protein
MDAISLLTGDHRTVETLFQQFEGEPDLVRRHDVGDRIIAELAVHAEIEETWFYPEVRRAAPDAAELTDEALHEHALVKQTLGQLQAMQAEDAGYVPLMRRLKGMVQHHVQEEENELFPKACAAMSKDELAEIGTRMKQRKEEAAAARA